MGFLMPLYAFSFPELRFSGHPEKCGWESREKREEDYPFPGTGYFIKGGKNEGKNTRRKGK